MKTLATTEAMRIEMSDEDAAKARLALRLALGVSPMLYEGRRCGVLTLLAYHPAREGHPDWTCRCDCGATITVRAQNLRSGRTRSCGCSKKRKAQ